VRGAAVRVQAAFINARAVLLGPCLFARRDNRTSRGNLKLTRAAARVLRLARLSVSNEPAAAAAGAFGSGFDNLRAKRKPATLHRLRFDPVCPDKQQRHFINS
jgi:hypothetical protein